MARVTADICAKTREASLQSSLSYHQGQEEVSRCSGFPSLDLESLSCQGSVQSQENKVTRMYKQNKAVVQGESLSRSVFGPIPEEKVLMVNRQVSRLQGIYSESAPVSARIQVEEEADTFDFFVEESFKVQASEAVQGVACCQGDAGCCSKVQADFIKSHKPSCKKQLPTSRSSKRCQMLIALGNAQVNKLERFIEARDADIKRLGSTVDDLTGQLSRAKQELTAYGTRLEEANATIHRGNCTLDALKAKHEKLSSQKHTLEQQKLESTKCMDAMSKRIKELEGQLEANTGKYDQVVLEYETLLKSESKTRRECVRLNVDVDDYNHRNCKLQKRVAGLVEERNQLQTKLNQQGQQVAVLVAQDESTQDVLRDLADHATALETQLEHLLRERQCMIHDFNMMRQYSDRATCSLRAYAYQVEQLVEQVDVRAVECEDARREANQHLKTCESYKKQLDKLGKQVGILRRENSNLKKTSKRLQASTNAQDASPVVAPVDAGATATASADATDVAGESLQQPPLQPQPQPKAQRRQQEPSPTTSELETTPTDSNSPKFVFESPETINAGAVMKEVEAILSGGGPALDSWESCQKSLYDIMGKAYSLTLKVEALTKQLASNQSYNDSLMEQIRCLTEENQQHAPQVEEEEEKDSNVNDIIRCDIGGLTLTIERGVYNRIARVIRGAGFNIEDAALVDFGQLINDSANFESLWAGVSIVRSGNKTSLGVENVHLALELLLGCIGHLRERNIVYDVELQGTRQQVNELRSMLVAHEIQSERLMDKIYQLSKTPLAKQLVEEEALAIYHTIVKQLQDAKKQVAALKQENELYRCENEYLSSTNECLFARNEHVENTLANVVCLVEAFDSSCSPRGNEAIAAIANVQRRRALEDQPSRSLDIKCAGGALVKAEGRLRVAAIVVIDDDDDDDEGKEDDDNVVVVVERVRSMARDSKMFRSHCLYEKVLKRVLFCYRITDLVPRQKSASKTSRVKAHVPRLALTAGDDNGGSGDNNGSDGRPVEVKEKIVAVTPNLLASYSFAMYGLSGPFNRIISNAFWSRVGMPSSGGQAVKVKEESVQQAEKADENQGLLLSVDITADDDDESVEVETNIKTEKLDVPHLYDFNDDEENFYNADVEVDDIPLEFIEAVNAAAEYCDELFRGIPRSKSEAAVAVEEESAELVESEAAPITVEEESETPPAREPIVKDPKKGKGKSLVDIMKRRNLDREYKRGYASMVKEFNDLEARKRKAKLRGKVFKEDVDEKEETVVEEVKVALAPKVSVASEKSAELNPSTSRAPPVASEVTVEKSAEPEKEVAVASEKSAELNPSEEPPVVKRVRFTLPPETWPRWSADDMVDDEDEFGMESDVEPPTVEAPSVEAPKVAETRQQLESSTKPKSKTRSTKVNVDALYSSMDDQFTRRNDKAAPIVNKSASCLGNSRANARDPSTCRQANRPLKTMAEVGRQGRRSKSVAKYEVKEAKDTRTPVPLPEKHNGRLGKTRGKSRKNNEVTKQESVKVPVGEPTPVVADESPTLSFSDIVRRHKENASCKTSTVKKTCWFPKINH